MMKVRIRFLGGVGTVTGSKYLVEIDDYRILVDCGLFQGYKQLRLRNWASLPVDPATIDVVLLSHAHLDHSGYLPVLIRNGFSGEVICSAGTRDLCAILLSDSGFLQERSAALANRYGYSKHHPARPLYTQLEGEAALSRFRAIEFGHSERLSKDVEVRLDPAGHILGAAVVSLRVGGRKLVFSGDLGRMDCPLMLPPTHITDADYLVVESTYGGRQHGSMDPEDALTDIITRTAARGGTVLIPAFAVGRAQLLLFHLRRLKDAERIPNLPIFLDSPMAINASEIFCAHPQEHRLNAAGAKATCGVAHYVRDVEESEGLNHSRMPMIIISASGMASGGRVLHYIKHFAPDSRNTILFTGYQAGGTRGAAMVGGAERVKIFGEYVPVRAEVVNLDMLSAHADHDEIMSWLGHFNQSPQRTFVTHGESQASDALRHAIEEGLEWSCVVPEYGEECLLD